MGIDCSGNIDETYNTIIEALDYFGVYAITRELPPAEGDDEEDEQQRAWKDVPGEEGTPMATSHGTGNDSYDMYAALAGDMNMASHASQEHPTDTSSYDYLDLLTDENAILLACGEVDAALDNTAVATHPRASTRMSGSKRKRSTMMQGSKIRKGRESLLGIAANPRASMEVISNRRTSMGGYSMFSKEYLDQL